MFSTEYRYIETLDDILNKLTFLKRDEIDGNWEAAREIDAIAAVLKVCGIKWKYDKDFIAMAA